MKLIPKILHTYWDRTPMSHLQALTVVSFRRLNPDWEIRVYIPKQGFSGGSMYIPDYKGADFFSVVENTPHVKIVEVDLNDYNIDVNAHDILRSDILRYNKLYEDGGVWSDFDVLWLRPMDYFKNIFLYRNVEFDNITSVVSLIKGTSGGHSIGILIHAKEDTYMKAIIDLTKKVKPPYSHEIYGSVMISSVYPTLDSLCSFKGLVGVKHETYYPYDIHPPKPTIHKLYSGIDLSYINQNVMCLHWYNGHRLSKDYLNNNGFKRSCSMTEILLREGYIT